VQWIAASAKDSATDTLEKSLWDAADQLRANSGLSPQQYSGPVLGLIFLRFAEVRFAKRRAELQKQTSGKRRGSRLDDPAAYHVEGVVFLVPDARFDFLLALPEGANIGSKVNDAMRAVERDNPQLAGVLPKTYELFSSTLLKQLLNMVALVIISKRNQPAGKGRRKQLLRALNSSLNTLLLRSVTAIFIGSSPVGSGFSFS
jgi:type I restriction enzyme M protein